MARRGKRYRRLVSSYERGRLCDVEEALSLIARLAEAKFDETVDVSIVLGIDAKKSDQRVRGSVVLPHGTGKSPKVAVIAKGEKAREAEEAGADVVGAEDLIDRIEQGWKEFDHLLATPDMMRFVSKLGKKLGPKMPSTRTGTVTNQIREVVQQLKGGRVDFRADPQGVVHTVIGKVSFGQQKLLENFQVLLDTLLRAKPPTARGQFIRRVALSTTMGPSVKVDVQKAVAMVR